MGGKKKICRMYTKELSKWFQPEKVYKYKFRKLQEEGRGFPPC